MTDDELATIRCTHRLYCAEHERAENGAPGRPRERIACGASSPDPQVERDIAAMRADRGYRVDGGCGGLMVWTYAYRCVECARWFHHDCILRHFAESDDTQIRSQRP